MVESIRYGDIELLEFKEIILKKLAQAQHDYNSFATKKNLGNGTKDTETNFNILEEVSEIVSKEESQFLANRQLKLIRDLEAALVRIENKTYGICRSTGNLIPKERLRAVPHATLSIDVKNSIRRR
jgi:DnaK suppressor protein